MDLPAVGIAGAPNAGKSSLLNALLGWERSIVSPQPKTTRDVLTGVLTTDRFQCVLFDCAGLVLQPDNPLDELAQRAAIEALQRCSAVLFCVDATKPDPSDDLAIRSLIQPKSVIYVATKSDLLPAGGTIAEAEGIGEHLPRGDSWPRRPRPSPACPSFWIVVPARSPRAVSTRAPHPASQI